jgi:retron-type reverse transcriptase
VSDLTSISQNWFDSTDNTSTSRQGVHALFVDFRKAFDLVDYKILLDKLADMNVTRRFWLWIMSFLEGRTQQVNLRGALSFTASCRAGVPQGSAISPTLFNIHINDMGENVSEQACVNTTKYADDCTMDTSIRTGESSDLQSALDSVQS